MPNGQDNLDDELELVTEEAETDDDQDATDSEQTEELNLDSEDDSTTEDTSASEPTPAEKSAKQQEDSWYAKVVAGKADVTDAPSWLQSKLNNRLNSTPKEEDLDRKIEEKLRQKEEQLQFKALLSTIPVLSKSKAADLKAKFQEFKPLGSLKALETALALTGIKTDDSKREARGRMSLPPSGRPVEKNNSDVLSIAKDEKKWQQFARNGYKM
jgi:hypothetical protein